MNILKELRSRREWLDRLNLCIRCALRPRAPESRSRCRPCLDYQRDYYAEIQEPKRAAALEGQGR